MKHTRILRPIGAELEDAYTRTELLDACERQLFAKARRMDVPFLLELLRALDDRPDEVAAPHRDAVWKAVCRGIRPAARVRVARRRASLAIALILLLLMLAGGCLAWAIRAGVVSFPSLALPWLPSSASPEAQTLVRRDLFSARYEHCELRVLEAAYDGHQICIVYSLTDTRPNPVLNEQDLWSASIPATRLDGIGCCDFLTLDGRDVFLSDTYQLFGERPGEVLYYLAANVDFTPRDVITVQIPLGELNPQTGRRCPDDVTFTLDTRAAQASARFAVHADVIWGNTRIVLRRAAFSPLHGLIEVAAYPVRTSQPCDRFEPLLYTLSGEAVEQEWYAESGSTQDGGRLWRVSYIPADPWPARLLLAQPARDGSPDLERCITLELRAEDEKESPGM